MKTIILLSCVSKKASHKSRARDLYLSPLFIKSLKYAESLNPDAIYILSAKHHLLKLDDEISPYDLTLNKMPAFARKQWGHKVIKQLHDLADLQEDKFIILAGKKYISPIEGSLRHIELPLKGMSIGKRLQFLNNQTK